jgi:beta-lactamase class A
MKGLSHAATTLQVCNFYYLLTFGKLINNKRSAEMLGYLKDPALTHKFVNTLQQIAPNATIYRKSGSWKNYHADSVLVWGPDRKYILVALVDNANGESIIRNLVKPLENVLKKSRTLKCDN